MWSKMFIGFHVKYPLFLSYFNETWFFSAHVRKILKYQIPLNLSSGNRVLLCEWADGQTYRHDEANSRLSQFCERSWRSVMSNIIIKIQPKYSKSPNVLLWHIFETVHFLLLWVKVKVKWSRYRPSVAQRVGRGIALLFHDRGTRRGWVVSSTPWPHFTSGKYPVPILQETGWVPGPVWTGGKSRPHQDSIPDRPARSQSIYRLSYPAHTSLSTSCNFTFLRAETLRWDCWLNCDFGL